MKKLTWPAVLLALAAVVTHGFARAVTSQSDTAMRERILSKDFSTAEQALEENRRLRDARAVCLSLEHPSLLIKRRAAEALGDLKDKGAVKCLVQALERNQVVLLGGSETQVEQGELNKSILGALNATTGLDLPVTPRPTPAQLRRVKAKTARWVSAGK